MTQTGMAAEATALARGMRTILLLAVLTALEFGVAMVFRASAVALVALLSAIAVLKAWLIVMYFMHLTRVWRGEEDH